MIHLSARCRSAGLLESALSIHHNDTATSSQREFFFRAGLIQLTLLHSLPGSGCIRDWHYERVKGHYLMAEIKKIQTAADRQQCIDLCFEESDFLCRSVNYEEASGQCSLSDMDRHTVLDKKLFQADSNGTIDYLESNCVVGKLMRSPGESGRFFWNAPLAVDFVGITPMIIIIFKEYSKPSTRCVFCRGRETVRVQDDQEQDSQDRRRRLSGGEERRRVQEGVPVGKLPLPHLRHGRPRQPRVQNLPLCPSFAYAHSGSVSEDPRRCDLRIGILLQRYVQYYPCAVALALPTTRRRDAARRNRLC